MTTGRAIDVAILGAGTAGLGARRAVQKAGLRPVLVDPGPFGTTCARVGCMPSKLLVAAADAVHHARRAPIFGAHPEGVRVDGGEVLGRLRAERDRFVGFVTDLIDEAKAADELVVGRARLVARNRLAIDDGHEIQFDRLVIATGSRPRVPPPFRELQSLMLSNENVFELEELPKSLLVIGTGVMGLELGQAFHRLGVRTTLLGLGGAIGPLADPMLLREATATLGEELDLHPDYELRSVQRSDGGVRIDFVDATGAERSETFERILLAAGRRPNLDALGLESVGIERGEDGWPIDPDTLQLGDAPYFVAGDANDLHPVLHEASDDGRIAGRNAAAHPSLRAAVRRTPLSIVFTDPQIAIVGTGYNALKECEAAVGEVDYENQGRARVQATNAGRARIYAELHTGRLLGAELFAPRAEHLAHLLAWAVQQRLTVDEALAMPFYHPVFEEGLRTALRNLNANLRHGAPIKCAVSELGVGA